MEQVSVIAYPFPKVAAGNARCNRSSSAGGIGAPPYSSSRSDERLRSDRDGSSISRHHMVGEPTVELTAYISMNSRILLGSNVPAKIPVMPALTTGMVWEFKPVMLNC